MGGEWVYEDLLEKEKKKRRKTLRLLIFSSVVNLILLALIVVSGSLHAENIVDTNFYDEVHRIYYAPNPPIGTEFTITGMWYKDGVSFFSNQAMIGRVVFWCCARDPYVIGFYIEGAPSFKQEQWISVTGKFQIRKTPQGDVPVLVCEKAGRSSDESPYIFPPSAVPRQKPSESIPGI